MEPLSAIFRFVAAFALCAVSPAAWADDARAPVSGELVLYLESDNYYRSGDRSRELSDNYISGYLWTVFAPAPQVSIETQLKLDVVRTAADDNRWFDDEAVWLRHLLLRYGDEDRSVFVGKHTLDFGTAFDVMPSIYGTLFADDYRQIERVGGGITVPVTPAEWGRHALTLDAFRLDTSFLSETVGARARFGEPDAFRARSVRGWHGGAANTEGPESWLVSLNGSQIPGLDGVAYHVARMHQAKGEGGAGDERGFAANLAKTFQLDEDVSLDLFGEMVRFSNYDAGPSRRRYLISYGQLNVAPWSFSVQRSSRRIEEPESGDSNDRLLEFDVGYRFAEGWRGDVSWARQNTSGIATEMLGLLLTYRLQF